MQAPIWLTPAGDLGIIPEQEYYEFVFDAYNPSGGVLAYSVISGNLPAGIEIKQNGLMVGIPSKEIAGVPSAVKKVTTSTFTIRITNEDLEVSDRTFQLTVAGILPQQITPVNENLGTFVDGTYIEIDINTIEPNSLIVSTFSIISGSLPRGLTLNSITGVISGYVDPIDADNTFQFVVEANNGVTIETKTYTMSIISISTLTADNTVITADNVGVITADYAGPYHVPVITTPDGLIGVIRQGTRADIQIVAEDFDNNIVTFEIEDPLLLPSGLTLNATSGWITGVVPSGALGTSTYTFRIRVYKTNLPAYFSSWYTFSIKILGQINDTVQWLSPSNLGTLYTGQISELYIAAVTPSGKNLNYALSNSAGRLPIGLQLTESGLLSGRVSFETTMWDSDSTLFDSDDTTFDQVFTFTVAAYDISNYVYDTKTFTISIVKGDYKPYENLYITAYPNRNQRGIYDSIINDSDIFPPEYIYRVDDPWFGKNTLRRSLFLSGLNPGQASAYIQAMQYNHYWKTLNFGQLKTAQALDDNFNITYEVVYIELIDNQVNSSGQGPALSVSLPPNSRNISTVYPNSFPNMAARIVDNIGYENRGALPKWMTSRQTDGTVLGFTRAMILCYTKPGKSAEIAYRVKQVQSLFREIDFTIDRYEWDNSYSDNYNKVGNLFIVNNFVYATGTISANTNSNIVTGLTLITVGTGTISGNFGDVIVYGVGTSFGKDVRVGKPIYAANTTVELGTVSSVTDNTTLRLTSPLVSTISGISYSAETSKTEFTTEIYVGDSILVDSDVIGIVKSINSDSNITLYANSLTTVSNVAFEHNARDTYSTPGNNDKYLKFPQVGVIT